MPSVSHEHPKATILFVGDPPKFDNQLRDGHPFQGKVGKFFSDGLEAAEMPAQMFEKTFCCVGDDLDKLNTPKQMTAAAATSLYPRLIQSKPLVVVACGASALKVICGDKYKIKDWAGKHFAFEFEHDGQKIQFLVFVSWSPGFLLHNDHLLEDYYRHFIAIKNLATNFDKEMAKQAESENVEYDMITDFDRAMKEIDRFDVAGELGKVIAWDLETSGLNPHAKHSRIGVLSMSIKERTASVFIWDHVESEWSKVQKKTWLKRLGQFFKNAYKFVAHNGKFDCKWIKKKCGVFPKLFADTQLMSYCLDETPGVHGLKALAVRYTDMGAYEDELNQHIPDKSAFCAYLTPPMHVVSRYAGADADCTLRLYNIFLPRLEKKEQFKRLGLKLLPKASNYLSEMEYNGAKVDLAYAQEYADELDTLSNDLLRQLRKTPAVQKYVCDRQEEQDEEYDQYIQEKYAGHKAKLREWKRLKAEHDQENEDRAKQGKRPLKFSRKKPDFETLNKRKRPDPFQFNVNSGDQLRAVLFDKLRYSPVLETDSGQPSTNKETLIHFKNEMGCKFSKTLLDYRTYSKLLGTYVKPLVENTQGFDTGFYVYGNFNLTSTATGRLSSTQPNLQNIPHKGAGGVKRCYISRWTAEVVKATVGEVEFKKLQKAGYDHGFLLAVDYSQIELRLAGSLSSDKTMLGIYKRGEDIHLKTCCGIYNITPEEYENLDKEDRKEKRRVAKVYNFGILYGMGAEGVVASLRRDDPPIIIEVETAQEHVAKFHKTYKGLSRWIDSVKHGILENGYVDSPFGRRRRLPEVRSSDEAQVARAQRQGVNHPVQSGASDMTLISGIIINREFKKRKMRTLPVITIHDSIMFDVFPGEAEQVMEICKMVMTNLPEHGWKVMGKDFKWDFLKCPIEIGVDVGYNWRDMLELGSKDDDTGEVIKTWQDALKVSAKKQAKADKTAERAASGEEDVRTTIEEGDEEAA